MDQLNSSKEVIIYSFNRIGIRRQEVRVTLLKGNSRERDQIKTIRENEGIRARIDLPSEVRRTIENILRLSNEIEIGIVIVYSIYI